MRRLTLVLACCGFPLAAASPQQRSVTLADALALAQRNAPAVIQAQGNARAASANVRSAWGEFLPRISSTASYGKSFSAGPSRIDPITQEVISGNSSSGSLGLGGSASIDLFTGFKRGADLSYARAGVTEADAGVVDESARAAYNTTTQFFQALQEADLVRVRVEAIQRAQEKLAIANAKLATRAATIADSLQAVVDVSRARIALLTEQQRLVDAEANLARQIGVDGRVAAIPDSALFNFSPVGDSAALLAEAITRSPAVIRADARVRSGRASLGVTRSTYLPYLNLTGNTSFNGSDRNSYTLFNTRGISLGLSWTLFNGFARERDMEQRRATLDAAIATAADARRLAGTTLTIQLAALHSAEERIALTAQSLEAARASARVQTERYRLGSIGIVELNAAQDALSSAELEAVSARFDYLRARAQIEQILGRKL